MALLLVHELMIQSHINVCKFEPHYKHIINHIGCNEEDGAILVQSSSLYENNTTAWGYLIHTWSSEKGDSNRGTGFVSI